MTIFLLLIGFVVIARILTLMNRTAVASELTMLMIAHARLRAEIAELEARYDGRTN